MEEPLETLIKNELHYIYEELNITFDLESYDNVLYGNKPVEPLYTVIYDYIAKDPIKYRYILDRFIENEFIKFFHQDIRNKLSLLYPEDEELTYKLLIDNTTYYKEKWFPNDNGFWDSDDCVRQYKLITHCVDIYFTHYFTEYYWTNPILKKFLESKNIKSIRGDKEWVHPELYKFYESRKK